MNHWSSAIAANAFWRERQLVERIDLTAHFLFLLQGALEHFAERT